MTIIGAARAMNDNHEIGFKRKIWVGGFIYNPFNMGGGIEDDNGDMASFTTEDLLADDWEVVE